jgi:hypothetical protein
MVVSWHRDSQHAFQHCWLAFTTGRYRSWCARIRAGWPAGERLRTGVNEPGNEPTGWAAAGRGSRFRGLRSAVHHRPRAYLTRTERRPAFARERFRTGRTRYKQSYRSLPGLTLMSTSGCPVSGEVVSWTLNSTPVQAVSVEASHLARASSRRCSDTDRVDAPIWSLAVMWWCYGLRPADRPPR